MIVNIIVFLLFLFVFFYKRKVVLYSSVNIFVIYFSLVVFFTILYHQLVPVNLKFNFYNFDVIGNIRFEKTITVFLIMLCFFYFGNLFFRIIFPNRSNLVINSDVFLINKKINIDLTSKALILILVLGLFFVFVDYGLELFIRTKYLPEKSSSFKTIYQILFIFISFFSGIINRDRKFLSIISISITLLVGLALGSRFASLYLIFYGITLLITEKTKIKRTLFLLWFTPFVLLFFGFNISLRTVSNSHGLIPYLGVIFKKPEIIYEYTLKNLYYSFVFGFYATADTIKVYTFYSWDKLIVCLSPLPGKMTNWYAIADKMRSNQFAPFTAIGELAKFKYFFSFYYFIVGFYFSFIDYHIKQNLISKKYIFPVLQILILAMFIIFSFEYNLRSANRYLYYSFIIFLLYYFFKKYKFTFKSKKNVV